jgi:hypothetical protein
MSANTIITSVVTAGSNNHTTVAEEANTIATDFVTQGVVGAITLNSGSGGTGSFCVNQNTGSNMAINILAGQAYITATPSSQGSQVLRARTSSDYTAYTINSNASGSTKYDWIYLKVDATKANNPAADASDVTSIYTSRSSSNATDNGTPPTYGLLLGYVTVVNGATAITNSNITDRRFNTSIGAQNGSLIVTQASTGLDAITQAAGSDANVSLNLKSKGTGGVKANGNRVWSYLGSSQLTTNFTTTSTSPTQVTGTVNGVVSSNFSVTVTVPATASQVRITLDASDMFASSNAVVTASIWSGTVNSGTQLARCLLNNGGSSGVTIGCSAKALIPASAGSLTLNVGFSTSAGTGTFETGATYPALLLAECC